MSTPTRCAALLQLSPTTHGLADQLVMHADFTIDTAAWGLTCVLAHCGSLRCWFEREKGHWWVRVYREIGPAPPPPDPFAPPPPLIDSVLRTIPDLVMLNMRLRELREGAAASRSDDILDLRAGP